MAKHWQAGRRGKEINKTSILENNVNLHDLVWEIVELKTTITKENPEVHKVKVFKPQEGKIGPIEKKGNAFPSERKNPSFSIYHGKIHTMNGDGEADTNPVSSI